MFSSRIVSITLGAALSLGGMLVAAGPAMADPGPSIKVSAWSSCNDRNRVVIRVNVKNWDRDAISARVSTPFGSERVIIRGKSDRTVFIRTDRRSVDRGTVRVRANELRGNDSSTDQARYRGENCRDNRDRNGRGGPR
jgi:hypothetical protein